MNCRLVALTGRTYGFHQQGRSCKKAEDLLLAADVDHETIGAIVTMVLDDNFSLERLNIHLRGELVVTKLTALVKGTMQFLRWPLYRQCDETRGHTSNTARFTDPGSLLGTEEGVCMPLSTHASPLQSKHQKKCLQRMLLRMCVLVFEMVIA